MQVLDLSGMALDSCFKTVPEDKVHGMGASLKAEWQKLGNRIVGGHKGMKVSHETFH
jgi:hypothetical protein